MSTPLVYPQRRAGVVVDCSGDAGRTKQSFKDDADINRIMVKFKRTGVLDWAKTVEPRFLDTTGADFQAAMEVVAMGKTAFAGLPAHVRNRFKNDPVEFLNFCEDPKNRAEGAEMGLWPKEATPPKGEAPEAPPAGPEAGKA